MTDLTGARWRKSTRSGGNGGECVEVADNLPDIVAVRDSKDPRGPILTFSSESWSAFVAATKSGYPNAEQAAVPVEPWGGTGQGEDTVAITALIE